MSCSKCAISELCKNPLLMGNGKKGSRIMVVQDSPHSADHARKMYMSGRGGSLFRAALEEVGISLEQVYFTSVVKCPTPEDRIPTTQETKNCVDYLMAEIEVINPEIIIPTGNIALKSLMGLTGITKHRGKIVIGEDGRKYLPIVHPNLVLKQPKYMDMFSEDIITLESTLNGTDVLGRPRQDISRRYCDTYDEAFSEIVRLIHLPSGSNVSVDLETVKTNPYLDITEASDRVKSLYPESTRVKIVAIGFSDKPGYGCAIPMYHRENMMSGNQIGTLVKLLRILLEREDINFIAQNGKFEIKWLRQQLNIYLKHLKYDTLLVHYLAITEEKGTHGLDDFAWLYTDAGGYDNELNGVKPTGVDEGNYDLIPWDILKVYLAWDCDVTLRVLEPFLQRLNENPKFVWIWENIMTPALYALQDIETNGVYVDMKWLSKIEKTYPVEIYRLEERLHQFTEVIEMEREFKQRWNERLQLKEIQAKQRTKEQQTKFEKYKKYDPSKGGCTINFGSIQQLSDLMFNRMGMVTTILTDTNAPSTNDESLKSMRSQNPKFVDALMEYRKVKNLYNNFVAVTRAHIDSKGCIHPSFNLAGTVTGRLSSNDPNAQQWPRKSNNPLSFQYWNDIKRLFVSRFGDDGIIVQYDYSQLELRILAVFSQDEALIELYRSGADLHKAIAALAFGIMIEEVTKDQRTASKKLQLVA